MSEVTLVLGQSSFKIAAEALRLNSNLLVDAPGLQTHIVRTRVSPQTFQEFLHALVDGLALSFTPDNISELELLSEEFGAFRLQRACEDFVQSAPQYTTIETTKFGFDTTIETTKFAFDEKVGIVIANFEELRNGLGTLTCTVNHLSAEVTELKVSMSEHFQAAEDQSLSALDSLKSELDNLKPALEALRRESTISTNFPMKERRSLDGIIRYLALKYRAAIGFDHIVCLTSNFPSHLSSEFGVPWERGGRFDANQWLCWDFGEMRVWPTHYTLRAEHLKSWVVEASADGATWIEIDRQTENEDFVTKSFEVPRHQKCRLIRIIRTDANPVDNPARPRTYLKAVEFFGDLFESTSSHVKVMRERLEMAALKLRIRMKDSNLGKGIISYLSKKYAGNVHDRGVMTITSKRTTALFGNGSQAKRVADPIGLVRFRSRDEPGQWICWDFREMRVCLAGYTFWSSGLESWVVEGSLDGENWTDLDRQSNWTGPTRSEGGWNLPSFPVVTSVAFRFLRLTQTDKSLHRDHVLSVEGVEFFGTLFE
jgi:hypothetical protein